MKTPGLKTIKLLCGLAAGLWLAGCSNSLVVEGQFPSPMVDKLPLSLGVHYEDEFRQYVYEEKSEDRSKWTIDSGKAQIELFNTILPAMFNEVVMVDELPGVAQAFEATEAFEATPEEDTGITDDAETETDASPLEETESTTRSSLAENKDTPPMVAELAAADTDKPVDLYISPRVDEFQYAMPRETKVNVFEIWIKYNMRVYDSEGQLIADWIMSAYGKTPTAFMKSKEEALNEAVIMALRDIGASLSLGFSRVPEIRAWLEQHNKTMITGSEAASS